MSGPIDGVLQAALGIREYLKAKRRARPPAGEPQVFYGRNRIPLAGEKASGGIVKFQNLQEIYPNSPEGYDTLYLLSSALLPTAPATARGAAESGARVVLNQNGVAFPAWHGKGFAKVNRPMADILRLADYVFYQSRFCKEAADRYLGEPSSPWKIVYNPVDTERFTPLPTGPEPDVLTLLAAGSHWQAYRVTGALETLALLTAAGRRAKLIVAGRLLWKRNHGAAEAETLALAKRLGIDGLLELTGSYTQQEAPDIMRRAHILLHTKCNDPCPGVVLEAMASGLPVVYSLSGGTPELVGQEGGVGVPSEVTWDTHTPPAAEDLGRAVLTVADHLSDFSAAARARTISHFGLQRWIGTHREIFTDISPSFGGKGAGGPS